MGIITNPNRDPVFVTCRQFAMFISTFGIYEKTGYWRMKSAFYSEDGFLGIINGFRIHLKRPFK